MEQEDKEAITGIHEVLSKLRNEHIIMMTIFGFYHRVALLNSNLAAMVGRVSLVLGMVAIYLAVTSVVSIEDSTVWRVIVRVFGILLFAGVLYTWIRVYIDLRAQEKRAKEIQQELTSAREDLGDLAKKTYSDDSDDTSTK